jgi:hypothetical protein
MARIPIRFHLGRLEDQPTSGPISGDLFFSAGLKQTSQFLTSIPRKLRSVRFYHANWLIDTGYVDMLNLLQLERFHRDDGHLVFYEESDFEEAT